VLVVELYGLFMIAMQVENALPGDHQTERQGVDDRIATHQVYVNADESLLRNVGRVMLARRHP
jgi:hypothetical protein